MVDLIGCILEAKKEIIEMSLIKNKEALEASGDFESAEAVQETIDALPDINTCDE